MSTERIRKVQNQKEYEQVIDEYITLGYKIKSRGQDNCRLQKAAYGGLASHVLVAILTCWWTFFIGNILWLVYNYVSNSDNVLVKIEGSYDNNNYSQQNDVHQY